MIPHDRPDTEAESGAAGLAGDAGWMVHLVLRGLTDAGYIRELGVDMGWHGSGHWKECLSMYV